MQNVNILKCGISDANLLAKTAYDTFNDAYAHLNKEDDFRKYLNEAFNAEKIRKELENPHSEYYFIYVNEKIAGYLKLNFPGAQSDLNEESSLEIERFYITRPYWGKGLANLLFDKTLEVARKNNIQYIWLGVWENNPRAIRFYEKMGFKKYGTHVFVLGDDPQTDLLMKYQCPAW